jgi:poly(A) polymerase Pap1
MLEPIDQSHRFPALTPAYGNLDSTQLTEYDRLVNITRKVYGNTIITEDAEGALQGPFNILL